MRLSAGISPGIISTRNLISCHGVVAPIGRGVNNFPIIRFYSKNSSSSEDEIAKQKRDKSVDRIHKIISKSRMLTKLNQQPRFKHYFDQLAETSPLSTITSFLILHEFTAIVPLFGFWWILYTLNLSDQYELPVYFTDQLNRCGDAIEKLVGNHYEGYDRNRLILSGAISYAIVKLLYPLRVLVSLWGAPYLVKWILEPFKRLRKFSEKTRKGKSHK
ncbi:LAFE_0G12772g1_1 [Lachancea fermentati]|uniref:LAFE_0G12772g1_1 n=1 Tax=Lachancea fermentati TaxID=4955 RepID=A0A1G4MIG7_LACFM|nr:LAFE_0G12772g1_1 [Lachancea fermentati]